ncbi:sugar ABC transporter substrate-binding protein [Microcella daejeonensis]|uniref:Sugar ABC transporter substrate-binding protein n=1 Tax=Microcella daejeonensis TaxID=2994971 RepID=A0A9E8MJJ4_9MICO|nr:sugar ABC transporter substrate-binding protein [Microcella daejeonensis]WAB80739.1 sugar ABC transporter substrate-binding protein [Microcella daejeonensis]WAB82927.1 sugar ABC transporter substrate-binding protein [Microcella daejeonensis]
MRRVDTRTAARRLRRGREAAVVVLAAAIVMTGCSIDGGPADEPGAAAGVGEGVDTRPSEPYTPSDDVGELPPRSGGLAAAMNVVNVEVFAATSRSMGIAADELGLDFTETVADGDPARNVDQLSSLLNQDVGATFVWDVDVAAQRPVVRELMDAGAAVFTLSSGPSTMPMVANQEQIGERIGAAVTEYIDGELGGEANVVIFNLDALPNIKPRFDAIRDALAGQPGVTVVSDVLWDTADPDSGFTSMSTILQANPDIDVVIGPDPVVLSALSAVEASGMDPNEMAFFGSDGEPEALELIAEGGPYKATYAFNFSIVGYAAGRWGADWLEGRSIPSLTIIEAVQLDSAEAIEQYNADVEDPATAFEERLSTYLQPLGSISYETRTEYWNEDNPQ